MEENLQSSIQGGFDDLEHIVNALQMLNTKETPEIETGERGLS